MYLRNVDWGDPLPFNEATINHLFNAHYLDDTDTRGVYVIWSVEDSTVIYVGSGVIFNRLHDHLKEGDTVKTYIDEHPELTFKAAYIEIPKKSKTEPDSVRQSKYEGIENYLGYIYRPLLRRKLDLEKDEKYPNETPREVNLLSNKYFKTSPVSEESTPYDINLDNWDEYCKAFCKWAKKQHGKNFAEPQEQKEDNH